MRTEYRIIPERTFIADLYLQFLRITRKRSFWGKEKIVTEWCYIPEESYSRYTGKFLTVESCPTSIPFGMEGKFLSAFHEQGDYELIPFTKTYPDIDLYFEKLKQLRSKHVQDRQRQEENAKIKYL